MDLTNKQEREKALDEGAKLFKGLPSTPDKQVDLTKRYKNGQPIAVEIDTLHQFIEYVEKLRAAMPPNDALIFRGNRRLNQDLMPSIMRKDIFSWTPNKDEVDQYEIKLIREFKKRARLHVDDRSRDERRHWEWLARAQHHFLPTRFLDWTERAVTALYFALDGGCDEYGVVWAILTPAEVDQDEFVYPRDIDKVYFFRPPHIVRRITVQQGCFTVHPSNYREKHHDDWIKGPVVRFLISKNNEKRVFDGLKAAGVDRAALFPELDGIALHLKETIRPTKTTAKRKATSK